MTILPEGNQPDALTHAAIIVGEFYCSHEHWLPGECGGVITPKVCCDCRDDARTLLLQVKEVVGDW